MSDVADLAAALRRTLSRHLRAGAWAAPGGATARPDPATLPVDEAVDDEAPARPRLALAEVRAELGDCTRCGLAATRTSIVFGDGPPDAPLVFVGEAPGADEDRQGVPFVGRAGELLDKMIAAMGWRRSQVYVTNVLKCRPPGNRTPKPDEVAACRPFLDAQLAALAPRLVVALGRPAANTVLGTDAPISALRGRFHDVGGYRVMPTFHPAYLLREPDRKRDAWSDLKLVMAELERLDIRPDGA
ncbi:MAG: uracil-DNA glycosylase [Kofleriaceae bacterium]